MRFSATYFSGNAKSNLKKFMNDENQESTVDAVDDLNTTETKVTDTTEQVVDEPKQKKTKEDNFDGLQKKFNANQKELKEYKRLLEEVKTQKGNEGKDELALLREEIEGIKATTQADRLNLQLEKANINPKYAKIAKSVVDDLMKTEGLDLAEATAKVVEEYPEFTNAKKSIGVPTNSSNANTSSISTRVLEGKAEDYFSLSPEEKLALRQKVMGNKTK